MKIITKKKIDGFALFLIIAGIGTLWLTFWWYKATLGDNSIGGRGVFVSLSVLYYYIFNSVLLILLGAMLRLRNFKIYSALAILLGISVTISLFIFGNGSAGILNNLFISTTYLGMIAGAMYGGTILVPMFLGGVYISAIRGIQHIRGKINYVVSDITTEGQVGVSETGNMSVNILNEKSIMQKTIPVIGIIIGLFNGINSWRFLFSSEIQGRGILLIALLPIFLIALSIFSLVNKKIKVYRVVNIIIVAIILYPFLLAWINMFFSLFG